MQTKIPAQLQAVTTLYGHKMLVNPSDAVGREVIQKGIYDHPSIDLLRNILSVQRCRTVLDIGANIGNHSLAFSQLCARLLAFESSKQAYEILKKNISDNNLRNIKAFNFGLSNTDRSTGPETPDASILKIGDAYLKSQLISDVDFIKIDAHGREQDAFEGLKTTLRQCRPLVLLEWSGTEANRSWILDKEITQSLFPNYQVFALVWNSNKHYWASKSFGSLRRNLIRIFTRKHKKLAKFDPAGHLTQVDNLLLVPTEKLPCVSQYVYR